MDRSLDTYNPPQLNLEAINLNGPIISNDFTSAIKALPNEESPTPDGFTAEF